MASMNSVVRLIVVFVIFVVVVTRVKPLSEVSMLRRTKHELDFMKFKLIMHLRPVRNFSIIVPHQLGLILKFLLDLHLPNESEASASEQM
jgi:hypothetical protein